MSTSPQLHDFAPDTDSLFYKIIVGLQKEPKELPNELLYDEQGSQLYDQVCEQEDYYVTRTELAIMQQYIGEMAAQIGPDALLVEYGSGSSLKTRLLFNHLPQLAGYVPIDISKEHLMQAAAAITSDYPHIEVLPVCADYTQPFDLPQVNRAVARRVAYYPGSTIGHLRPDEAVTFLEQIRTACGPDSALLIGVDLKKDPQILTRAYNDNHPNVNVKSSFCLNTLHHMRRRFSTDLQPDNFRYQGFYNETLGRIELHIISCQDQVLKINDESISFHENESILIGYSYKYTLAEFESLASKAGWSVKQVWVDKQQLVSVQYLTATV